VSSGFKSEPLPLCFSTSHFGLFLGQLQSQASWSWEESVVGTRPGLWSGSALMMCKKALPSLSGSCVAAEEQATWSQG
jgi:hypothetical protein